MVASLDNTVKKWQAVWKMMFLPSTGRFTGTREVQQKNVTSYLNMKNHFIRSYNNRLESSYPADVRRYYANNPNKRKYVTQAYNKLNNVARELAGVRRKSVATSTIQRHWRAARSAVMNRRKTAALIAMTPLVPNTRRIVFEAAFPKPVYGPKTRNESRRRGRYSKY